MRITLTWVIPPLDPVLPSSWVTLAFTGSESMAIIILIFILFTSDIHFYNHPNITTEESQLIRGGMRGRRELIFGVVIYCFEELIKLMRFSYYKHSPQRVNPEFIGIANKYSAHKKKRLNIEKRKKELDSDVLYTVNLDRSLQKNLESKLIELDKLQQAHQRHEDQIRYKQELQQKRRRELQNLRERNTQNRLTTKLNIEDARKNLMKRNKTNKEELQLDLSRLSQRFQEFIQSKRQTNQMKYNEIRQQKKLGKSRVNSFHRERNRQSLNNYLEKIKKQRQIKRAHTRRIQDHENKLNQLSKTVQFKKTYLQEIQSEIFKYRTDLKSIILSPPRSRKNTQSNKSESRFIPGDYSQIIRPRQGRGLEA